MKRVENKVVSVTRCALGIGKETCLLLSKEWKAGCNYPTHELILKT